jgi:adenylosuccinate lyase
MAHKRNPKNFENVVSMSKQVTAQIVNANLNLSSEHQRDLTDSASARFYPIAVAAVASMADRLNHVMGKIEVDEAAMQHNLELTGGAIAAEPLYLLLAKHGHPQAHETSKELAHEALQQGVCLYDIAAVSPAITKYWQAFSTAEKAIIKHPEINYSGLAAKKTLLITTYWKKVTRGQQL